MIGKQGIEKAFDRKFANQFNIHRTRQNFPNDGIDTFENMAETGLKVIDNVVIELMDGSIENNMWIIPVTKK